MTASKATSNLAVLTADIVIAYLAGNKVANGDLPSIVRSVGGALAGTGTPAAAEAVKQQPAVSIWASINHDYLICLEDGREVQRLSHYLRLRYGMSPADYRAKWRLPWDYPMVAPAYAEKRRSIALGIKLGHRKKIESAITPHALAWERSLTAKRGS